MWSIDIYKGEDALVSIPFNATGYNSFSASFYTTNEVKIERSIEDFVVSGGNLSILFQNTDLDILPDGVLRYTLKYKVGENDRIDSSNTEYVIKTPISYSAISVADIFLSGETYQKTKLVSTAITVNGTYQKEDGYNSVSVNVAQTGHTEEELEEAYESGYTAGEDQGFIEGKSAGIEEQKAKLRDGSFDANGVYFRDDGWSEVSVNVQTTQVVTLTQAQYNALAIKDNNTIYLING